MCQTVATYLHDSFYMCQTVRFVHIIVVTAVFVYDLCILKYQFRCVWINLCEKLHHFVNFAVRCEIPGDPATSCFIL